MRIAEMPIAVIMQRRTLDLPWASDAWAAVAAVPDPGDLPAIQPLGHWETRESYLVSGLRLELYPDENEGYFENWAAPEPKVFIMWRMQNQRAMPVLASVSYGEGARMLDSGESADGVAMAGEIQAWLARYLQTHYQPSRQGGKHHDRDIARR